MPVADSPVVARMKAAGAVILGKTNVPVLSHTGSHANDSWAGPTYNAAGREFLPGGSSAGTATAVAASMAVLGLAEETGGSIQNPASAQGLVGIKPTFALVPNAGVDAALLQPRRRRPDRALREGRGALPRCARRLHRRGSQDRGGHRAPSRRRLRVEAPRRCPAGGSAWVSTGPGWRDQPLSLEADELYRRARNEMERLGTVLVDDPFAGSGFASLREPTPPLANFDARGLESVPHDLQKYLERLGPDAALRSFADFARATAAEDAFAPSGVLGFMPNLPQFGPCLAEPVPPAGPVGVHGAEGALPGDLRRGMGAPAARRLGVPADA